VEKVARREIEIVLGGFPRTSPTLERGRSKWFENGRGRCRVDVPNSSVDCGAEPVARERRGVSRYRVRRRRRFGERLCAFQHHKPQTTRLLLSPATRARLVKKRTKTWYFLNATSAARHGSREQPRSFRIGGKVLGSVKHPAERSDSPRTCYSRRASGAKAIGQPSGNGPINAIKQAVEFGLTKDESSA